MTVTVKNAAGPYIGRLRVFNREADGSGTEVQAEEKVLLPGQEATVSIWDRRYFSVDEIGEAKKPETVINTENSPIPAVTQVITSNTAWPTNTVTAACDASSMPAGPADPAE